MSSSYIIDKLQSSTTTEAPAHIFEFDKQIINLEFSPYLWSHDLICIAFIDKLRVAVIKFQEENDGQIEEVEYTKLQDFPCNSRVHSISWSPEANIRSAPKCILFACSMEDFKINVYNSKLTNSDQEILPSKVVCGHVNYVNDIAYNTTGEYLASASDDLTCRIWLVTNNYEEMRKFYLRSPGVAVKWHQNNSGQVMVGEKYGSVLFYNVTTGNAIMSLRSQASPLLSLDWSPSDSSYVSAMCGGNLVIWYIPNPSSPFYEQLVHPEGGFHVKFLPLSEQKLVSLGAPDNTLKLFSTTKRYPQTITTLKLAHGLTCHHHLPYICVGVDNLMYIWNIS
uniref:Putative nucleoporin 37 n=1 Tax=Triatoma infestans TaxID=30076 RepID=A0A023FA64_TRIIF